MRLAGQYSTRSLLGSLSCRLNKGNSSMPSYKDVQNTFIDNYHVLFMINRRSPRLHKTEEDDVMSQQDVPNKTPADEVSTVPSSALEKSQRPCNDPYNCPPQETNSPCGEGTSNKDTVPPLAAVKVEGVGHVPSSSEGYLGCAYMRSVYNTCSSVLKAAITAVSLSVSAEEEDEQEQNEEEEGEEEERKEEEEEYSENTCIICALLNKMKRCRPVVSPSFGNTKTAQPKPLGGAEAN
ncbi:hypothetical protein A6R68_04391 [Neotoma lepida]|uniref:Uncharacterized protein n=1 Tax=Neotoma lepida TaxID=56216 RepID=A0A1A6GLI2_NEOLE|nr:hypothetical protein A6R68_04391 [Neotoma lepida]